MGADSSSADIARMPWSANSPCLTRIPSLQRPDSRGVPDKVAATIPPPVKSLVLLDVIDEPLPYQRDMVVHRSLRSGPVALLKRGNNGPMRFGSS
jgi:hypothetical protein